MGIAIKLIVDECKTHKNCDIDCPFYDSAVIANCEFDGTPDQWDLERIADICLSIVEEDKS